MQRVDRNVIDKIIAVRPFIYAWQDEIDEEQERVINDLESPAKKTVERLIALDNMRIDICNLKVLYAFIERELGAAFGTLLECSRRRLGGKVYDAAGAAIKLAGYDVDRARREFGYIFKRLRISKSNSAGSILPPLVRENAVGAQEAR